MVFEEILILFKKLEAICKIICLHSRGLVLICVGKRKDRKLLMKSKK